MRRVRFTTTCQIRSKNGPKLWQSEQLQQTNRNAQVKLSERCVQFGKPKRGGGKRFTNARVLSAQNNEAEGMWGDKRDKEDGDDSDEDSEEDDEEDEDEESDSDDGLGGSTRAGPSRVSFASTTTTMPTSAQQTPGQPALKPGDIDKFGNVVQEPELTKREAKRAAKAKEAAKAQQQQGKQAAGSDSESESSDDDPLLQAGSANKGLNKQMKMSSLGDAAKKPAAAAPQAMNRKERYVHGSRPIT